MGEIDLLFSTAGGKFWTTPKALQQKLSKARAIIFDWDGVFNNGSKSDSSGSPFSEPDAMGVNLLRFSFWLSRHQIPPTAILSGEENRSGLFLAKREHYASVYFKSTDKIKSLYHFLNAHQLSAEEVIFVFDDILDLSLAAVCGVRIQVNRKASPLFNQYVTAHRLVDYVTAQEGSHFAVREACELIMGLNGTFDQALHERMMFSDHYKEYLAARQALPTHLYYLINGEIKTAVE